MQVSRVLCIPWHLSCPLGYPGSWFGVRFGSSPPRSSVYISFTFYLNQDFYARRFLCLHTIVCSSQFHFHGFVQYSCFWPLQCYSHVHQVISFSKSNILLSEIESEFFYNFVIFEHFLTMPSAYFIYVFFCIAENIEDIIYLCLTEVLPHVRNFASMIFFLICVKLFSLSV